MGFFPICRYLACMKRLWKCAALSLGLVVCQSQVMQAQDEEVLRAALYLTGSTALEDLDQDVVERLEVFRGRKIPVNGSHLRPSLLLSEYQVASLADYRSRCGDILSWEELALVDGFSGEAVAALRPFLSLASTRLPGQVRDSVRCRGKGLVRTTLKQVGAKLRLGGETWQLQGTWRGREGTVSGEFERGAHRVVLGHFNLRFGQGVGLWTGFSMESLSTVDAFVRRPAGISPVWSYSPSGIPCGVAYAYSSGGLCTSAFACLDGSGGVRVHWLSLRGQAGLTVRAAPGDWLVSVDGRYTWGKALLVAEAAVRHHSAGGKATVTLPLGERARLAVQARALPSRYSGKKNGEYALAAGLGYESGRRRSLTGKTGFGSTVPVFSASLTADAALLPVPGSDPRRLQCRLYATALAQLSGAWSLETRFTGRYRNYERARTDLRADVKFASGPWLSVFRTELIHCERWGFLCYQEGGYKNEALSIYLRLTGFAIDHWNDRIYCFERDAPGNFSVPAYSGRGLSASLAGGYKFRLGRRVFLCAHLRAAWMVRAGRTPTPTLNLQFQCDI